MARIQRRAGWASPKAPLALGLRARLPRGTSRPVVVRVVGLVAIFALAVGFGYLRAVPTQSALAADPVTPTSDDPRYALFHAADLLDSRLAADGPGLSFTATQLQILKAAPGGPVLMLMPDRENPDRVPTPVDSISVGSLSGRGAAHGDAYFAEWFNGTTVDGLPTYEGSVAYAGLAHNGQLWRRDEASDALGRGWVSSADVPGFGIDPITLRDFSEVLRRLENVSDLGVDADGHHWSGTVDSLWFPGAVAVDGAPFTGSPIAVEVWIAPDGQLASIFAVAQNLNETTYQLLCIDKISFADVSAVAIPPEPSATAAP